MTPTISRVEKIRDLNDEFRHLGPLMGRAKFDGLWLVTGGVQAEGPVFTWAAILAVQNFSDFSADSHPHGEHDFGSFELHGRRVFWTFDYLERGTQFGAEDPSNNATTFRVITIMLDEEW
jgi:hypothetical protein